MRVLHIVTHMNRGGLETMIMNYYRKMDKDKVQFDFLVHRENRGDYDDEIESLGGKIYRLPFLNPLSVTYRIALDSFFKNHSTEYDIVHCHLDCMAGLPLKYAKKYNLSVRIAHAHNTSQEKNIKYAIKSFYKRLIPRYATHLFACSNAAGKWMFESNTFEVMHNAIDSKEFEYNQYIRDDVRKELGFNDEEIVIGHIGRFDLQKNHTFLINIFSEAFRINSNTKLLLIGDGELRAEIQDQVRALGLVENVVFTGVRADIPRLLQAMDVFVFPSLFEGLPVTMVEAQASGLPCVISDKVPKESVLVSDIVSIINLSASPKNWAECVLDVSRKKRIGRANEIIENGFDIVAASDWLEKKYSSMIVANKGGYCVAE